VGHPAAFALDNQKLSPAPKFESMVREILTPQDRPVRLRLEEWATARLGDLAHLKENAAYHEPEICGSIVDCYNEAALIEVYYGRQAHATNLCHAAMKWVADVVKDSGNAACYRFAIQPYVNLGRLDRIAKRWQESLDKFKVADEVSRGNPVAFGPIVIDPLSLEQMASTFPDVTVLESIYILDTLKTLLKAEWYGMVLDYFPNWESIPNLVHRDFICEAFLVALAGLEEYDRALELSGQCLHNSQGRNRLVFLYRRAEILAAAGQLEQAMRIVQNLAAAFAGYRGELTQSKLIVLAALCHLMIRLGVSEMESLLCSGLAAASRLRDVFLERDFLQMLAQTSVRQESKDELRHSLQTLNATSLYNAAQVIETKQTESIHQLSRQLFAFAGYHWDEMKLLS
jgi:tetratricopeptide (TPR) repeat protein